MSGTQEPLKVVISGAGGNISYILSFRVANGEVFGENRVHLVLVDIPIGVPKVKGLMLELIDGAFPKLAGVSFEAEPAEACKDADFVFMLASAPLLPGMVRADLLKQNVQIFKLWGESLCGAKNTCKVLVIGNPVNTASRVAMHYASKTLAPENFCALSRLDHNRAVSQIAQRTGVTCDKVKHLYIWGNHSQTQVPDVSTAFVETADGKKMVTDLLDEEYLHNEFVETVALRGIVVLEARGGGSVVSAVHASVNCAHDWWNGTDGRIVSMGVAVPAGGLYGVKEGIVCSMPCTVDSNGTVTVVKDLPMTNWLKTKLSATEADIVREREEAFTALGIN